MSDKKTRESIAFARATLIQPLMNSTLDRASRAKAMREISEIAERSERTIRRWVKAYEAQGFEGLLPDERDRSQYRVIPEYVVDQAVILRREVPERSVSDIILLLEMEGFIEPGSVKRSTLQDQLMRRGYSNRQLSMYIGQGAGAARRFQRTGRNDLWQADIKYLLKITPSKDQNPVQLYVSVFIDDATRMVTGARVYSQQDIFCVTDCFRRALETYGIPDRLYTDNGKVYKGTVLKSVCVKLGIKLIHAKPYSPASKGKVEKFNKLLDKFVQEERLESPTSVEKVQHDLDCWLDRFYFNKEHAALDGKTPVQAFDANKKMLRFASFDELNKAFETTETRIVDKTGCLSFRGIKYEAGPEYIGLSVSVSYSGDSWDMLTIDYPEMESKVIYPLTILEHTRQTTKFMTPLMNTDKSRILTAARKRKEKQDNDRTGATSFKDI